MHHTCSQRPSHAWAVNLITFHRLDMAAWLIRAYATWHVESEAPSMPPPSTFSFCCSTLTPSASSASSDVTHRFLSRCHCFLGPWGKRILAALVLGCINLVFYYQSSRPCVPEPLIFPGISSVSLQCVPQGRMNTNDGPACDLFDYYTFLVRIECRGRRPPSLSTWQMSMFRAGGGIRCVRPWRDYGRPHGCRESLFQMNLAQAAIAHYWRLGGF